MVLHVNNKLANRVFGPQKLIHHLDWLAKLITMYNAQVVMGDFNMALFMAVKEFRSRGMVVDAGARYPWKSLKGEPMSDSCGIFFINLPGEYMLHIGPQNLHSNDADVLFFKVAYLLL